MITNTLTPARFAVAVLIVFGAVACGDRGATQKAKQPYNAARIAESEKVLERGPAIKTYEMGDAELVVVKIPTSEYPGLIEQQTCYVWRDRMMQSATMTCPHSAEPFIRPPEDNEGPEIDR